ncbi:uncharacterized protein LOC62_06G008582 [Vanrija pseudolonga]|uniref:UBA domain-containing protein n=1 Tax=Vanrija pseudolonga TaxID=143232 RepID=A0AAF0YGC8_9TREE|nr:hypothetical protein LOC62_06G008582 [Vanrija pseudolonga]
MLLSRPSHSWTRLPDVDTSSVDRYSLHHLMSLGYDEESATRSLQQTKGNVPACLRLLEHERHAGQFVDGCERCHRSSGAGSSSDAGSWREGKEQSWVSRLGSRLRRK